MSKNLSEWTATDGAACTRSVRSLARQDITLTSMTVTQAKDHAATIAKLTDVFVRQAA